MARKQATRKPGPAGNWDYIEHGSDAHATHLGLKKAEEGDDPVWQGWALVDVTMWGPTATERFLLNILKGKVAELTSTPPKYQSDDPLAPNYAPPLWEPKPEKAIL